MCYFCIKLNHMCICTGSQRKASRWRYNNCARSTIWCPVLKNTYKEEEARGKKRNRKNKTLDGHHLSSHYIKSTSIRHGGEKMFVKMKRVKGWKETGARHSKATQTQHWTQDHDCNPGDARTDTATVWVVLRSHAGGAAACFSWSFKFQPTLHRQSVYSTFSKHVWCQSWHLVFDMMLGAAGVRGVFVMIRHCVSSKTIAPDSSMDWHSLEQCHCEAGRRLDGGIAVWKWVLVHFLWDMMSKLPGLTVVLKVLLKLSQLNMLDKGQCRQLQLLG